MRLTLHTPPLPPGVRRGEESWVCERSSWRHKHTETVHSYESSSTFQWPLWPRLENDRSCRGHVCKELSASSQFIIDYQTCREFSSLVISALWDLREECHWMFYLLSLLQDTADDIRAIDSCEYIWEAGVGFAQAPPLNYVHDLNRWDFSILSVLVIAVLAHVWAYMYVINTDLGSCTCGTTAKRNVIRINAWAERLGAGVFLKFWMNLFHWSQSHRYPTSLSSTSASTLAPKRPSKFFSLYTLFLSSDPDLLVSAGQVKIKKMNVTRKKPHVNNKSVLSAPACALTASAWTTSRFFLIAVNRRNNVCFLYAVISKAVLLNLIF